MPTITDAFTAVGIGKESIILQPQVSNFGEVPMQSGSFTITGTFTATLVLEYSTDSVVWTKLATYTTTQSATTLDPGNAGYYRWRCSAYTSGTATVVTTISPQIYSVLNGPTGAVVFQVDETGVTAQLNGQTAAGSAAPAGGIGEVISSVVSAVAAGATTVAKTITSITLTPGYWCIDSSMTINQGATGLTTGSVINASVVTTTNTNGTQGSTMSQQSAALTANGFAAIAPPTTFVNITTATTYYLTAQCAYTAGSPTVSGRIDAVRIR